MHSSASKHNVVMSRNITIITERQYKLQVYKIESFTLRPSRGQQFLANYMWRQCHLKWHSSHQFMAKTLTLATPWILCSVLQLHFNPDLINYNLFVQCTFSHIPVESPVFLYVYLLINIPKHFRKKRNTQCIHTGTSTICCAENYKEGRGMSTPCVKKEREEQTKRHGKELSILCCCSFFLLP